VKFSFPDASSAAASSKEIQNYQPINAKNKTNKQKETKTLPDIWFSRNAFGLIFSPFLSFWCCCNSHSPCKWFFNHTTFV